jgi:competence protein ComEC
MIAGYFIQIASFFVQISVHFINKLAALSWSSFSFTKPNIPEIVAFYLFIFLLLKLIDRRDNTETKKGYWVRHPLLLKYIIITLLFFFCADAVYLWSKDRFTSNLRITAIDVGQGCATLVRFPGGKNMLVDGGGFADSTFDMGKLVIAPFLYHERISTIDIVVLSHPHPDHLQGLLYVTDNFDVQEVWITGVVSDDEIYREWEKIINRRSIKINYMSAQSPKREINGVDVRVLWPLKSLKINAGDQYYDMVNDESMVINIDYGDVSFLLPGDISAYVENLLIKSGQDLQSDALFAAHHGSSRSSSREFIRKLSCSNAIFSTGKNNPFRHPHPATLERFNSADINIFRTDKDGAITMVTDGNTLAVDTYVKSNRPCP